MQETHFQNGAVVIYQRRRSSVWQARVKVGKGSTGWKRFSTHEQDSVKAGEYAVEKYFEYKVMQKYGLSPVSKSFRHCATIAEKEMRQLLEAGTGKIIYWDYIRTLHKYLIPFFGSYNIDTIDYSKIVEFSDFRTEKLGRVPALSTIRNHNATLKRVFSVAVKNRWIRKESIPLFESGSDKRNSIAVRPHFENEELRELLKFLKSWRDTGRKAITRQIRTLLYDYVYIVAYTGIRPGTEADYIRFSDIKTYTDKSGRKYLHIRVNGKTGERLVPADRTVKKAIDRLTDNHHAFKDPKGGSIPSEFIQLEKCNNFIFELEETKELPKDLGRAFSKALQESRLENDQHGKKRTLYSLRHSYATRILLDKGTDIHLLARHMGTSVAMIEKYYSHVLSIKKAEAVTLTDSLEDDLDMRSSRDEVVSTLKKIRS